MRDRALTNINAKFGHLGGLGEVGFQDVLL